MKTVDQAKEQMMALEEKLCMYTLYPHTDSVNFCVDLVPDEESRKLLKKYIPDNKICEALIDDNVFPVCEAENHLVLYDCMIGMPYMLGSDGIFCINDYMTSAQHDVKEAAALRWRINNQSKDSCRVESLVAINMPQFISHYGSAFMGYSTSSLFEPLPIFDVYSSNELNQAIREIQKAVGDKRLWYRGQAKEYTFCRSKETIQTLQLPQEFECVPSLLPSLGRVKKSTKLLVTNYNCWMEVFNIWLISENSDFRRSQPQKYNEVLSQLHKLHQMPEYCKGLRMDPRMPENIEEVLCGNKMLYKAGVLCMQQYGMSTSYLDITTDIDIALYFTQSRFNKDTKQIEEVEPNESRVIYVFPDLRGTVTLDSGNAIFSNTMPWPLSIPKRLVNQQCGLLSGANGTHKNNYSFRTIAKIVLHDKKIISPLKHQDLFPDRHSDTLFDILSQARPSLNGLYG